MGVKFFTFYRLCPLPLADFVRRFAWPGVLQESSSSCFTLTAESRVPGMFLLILLFLTCLSEWWVALVMAAAGINSELWLCNASNAPCLTGYM